jgi:ribosomal protein L11 methyltransferase
MEPLDRARGDDAGEAWSLLAATVPRRLGDALLALLGAESLGVWAAEPEGDEVRLRFYFASTARAREARSAAERTLRHAGVDLARCELTLCGVADERWLERYQQSLQPFPLGSRFVVCPAGQAAPGGGRVSLQLVPGRAFGTGEHPTTRLCVELIERRLRPGDRWVDLGCGSGILSLVALACGAREVLALDVDPSAVEVAREVLARNGAEGRVELVQGSTPQVPAGRDGIVANILSPFFLEQAPELARRLRDGGMLLASGFDAVQHREVREALSAVGLREVEQAAHGEWRATASVRERSDG